MQEIPVVSSNPISLVTSEGKQLMIPLSALYFDSSGNLKADRWPLYSANQSLVLPFLKRLRESGSLQQGPVPAAKPALKATSVTVGGSGVLIEIEFSNVVENASTPQASTADVKVTETDTYPQLALDKLGEILGNASGGGKYPGLVFVSGGGTPAFPRIGQYPLMIANSGDPAKVDIPKKTGSGIAFTLEARNNDAEGANIKVEVKEPDVAAHTFTLVISWKKSVTAKRIDSLADEFAFAIMIEAPESGYRAPISGKSVLTGGTDAISVAAGKSFVTVLASQ